MDLVHFKLERSDDNKFGIWYRYEAYRSRLCEHVTLHYIQSGTKSEQGSEFRTVQRPGTPRNFPWDRPSKFGIVPVKSGWMVTLVKVVNEQLHPATPATRTATGKQRKKCPSPFSASTAFDGQPEWHPACQVSLQQRNLEDLREVPIIHRQC